MEWGGGVRGGEGWERDWGGGGGRDNWRDAPSADVMQTHENNICLCTNRCPLLPFPCVHTHTSAPTCSKKQDVLHQAPSSCQRSGHTHLAHRHLHHAVGRGQMVTTTTSTTTTTTTTVPSPLLVEGAVLT